MKDGGSLAGEIGLGHTPSDSPSDRARSRILLRWGAELPDGLGHLARNKQHDNRSDDR
jgi:hypothetical protein